MSLSSVAGAIEALNYSDMMKLAESVATKIPTYVRTSVMAKALIEGSQQSVDPGKRDVKK